MKCALECFIQLRFISCILHFKERAYVISHTRLLRSERSCWVEKQHGNTEINKMKLSVLCLWQKRKGEATLGYS